MNGGEEEQKTLHGERHDCCLSNFHLEAADALRKCNAAFESAKFKPTTFVEYCFRSNLAKCSMFDPFAKASRLKRMWPTQFGPTEQSKCDTTTTIVVVVSSVQAILTQNSSTKPIYAWTVVAISCSLTAYPTDPLLQPRQPRLSGRIAPRPAA